MQEYVGRRLGGRRDPPALQIGERLDALIRSDPELRGSDLDVIDQEAAAGAER